MLQQTPAAADYACTIKATVQYLNTSSKLLACPLSNVTSLSFLNKSQTDFWIKNLKNYWVNFTTTAVINEEEAKI